MAEATITRLRINESLNTLDFSVQGILDDILKAIKDGISSLSNLVNGVQTYLSGRISSAVSSVTAAVDAAADGIVSRIQGLIDGIGDTIERVIGWIRDKLQAIIDRMGDLGRSIGQAIGSAINHVVASITDWIGNILAAIVVSIGNLVTGLRNTISGLIGGIRDWLSSQIEAVRDWISDVYNRIRDWIKGVIDHLQDVYQGAKKTVEEYIGRLIAWLVETSKRLSDWVDRQMVAVGEFLATEVLPRFTTAVEAAQAIAKLAGIVWGKIQAGDYQGAFDIVDDFMRGIGLPAPIATLHAIVSAIAYFWLTVRLQFVGLEIAAAKRAEIALGLDPIPHDAAALGVFRGVGSIEEFYANATLAGVTRGRAELALEAARNYPTPGQIQEAFLRGEISEDEHDRLLSSYGYHKRHIDLLKALYWLLPTPSDLIRMGVREVFSPEVAERFGQYEDIPEAFLDWAEKIGISRDWASRYWAAHWDLPSATMGFEMFHRRIIDKDELILLLRALDIMPYWRERLIQLSYNPITRVDLRRMYKMGVLTEQDVYNGYLDLGYSPENASRLTEFTKRYSAPEDESEQDEFRRLARGVYSQAYRKRILAVEEYREMLHNLGYSPDDANLLIMLDDWEIAKDEKPFDLNDYRRDYLKLTLQAYDRGVLSREDIEGVLSDMGYDYSEIHLELSLVDYNRNLRLRNTITERVREQYVTRIIDNIAVHEILNVFNLTSNEIERLLEEWDIERSFRTRRPSLSDLRRFYNQGLITLDELLEEMRGEGYHEKYIELYRQSLTVRGGT